MSPNFGGGLTKSCDSSPSSSFTRTGSPVLHARARALLGDRPGLADLNHCKRHYGLLASVASCTKLSLSFYARRVTNDGCQLFCTINDRYAYRSWDDPPIIESLFLKQTMKSRILSLISMHRL